MKSDNYIDFGEEIGRTVRKVLNNQDFYDLKNMINRTMRGVPGMGGGPFFEGPGGVRFPRLSEDDENEAGYGYSGPQYGGQDSRQNRKQGSRQNGGKDRTQGGGQHHRKSGGASAVPGILLLIFGSIGAVATGLTLLVIIALENTILNIPALEAAIMLFGGLFLGSLAMIIAGARLRKRLKRFRLYQRVLNGRTYCTICELSAASGLGPKFIVKDLRRMIHAGLFAEGYLDEQKTCLMTDYETYNQYLETMRYAEAQKEAEKRENEKWANREGGAALKETIDEGKNYIKAIKAANDALPEEEISEKLDELERVTGKIFSFVEHHPEKLPEIRKFMSYYMPITLKLVNAYQKFDRHGTNTSEIEATKLEIKGTLDTINKAYRNLLKKLMQADILDVSSDISALETILAQEGLTGDDFKKNGSAKLS